jgi:hypothetical protein
MASWSVGGRATPRKVSGAAAANWPSVTRSSPGGNAAKKSSAK